MQDGQQSGVHRDDASSLLVGLRTTEFTAVCSQTAGVNYSASGVSTMCHPREALQNYTTLCLFAMELSHLVSCSLTVLPFRVISDKAVAFTEESKLASRLLSSLKE